MGAAVKKIIFLLFLFAGISRYSYAQAPDSLLKLLQTKQADTTRVKTLIDIGWEYSYSDIPQTEKYAAEALALSQKIKYPEGIAESYNLFGIAGRSSSDYAGAIENFNKALQIRIRLNQPEKEAKTYVNMANVYLDMADYAMAERYYKTGIEKAKQIRSKQIEIAALTNLSVVYQNLADYGKSLDCLFESLQLNKELKDIEQEGFIYTNIGLIYQEQNQYKLSEEYALKALQIFKDLKREDMLANIYNNLGIVYKNSKQYDLALKNYEESMRLYKKVGMDFTSNMVLHNIGGVYFEMKQYDKALQCQQVVLAEALESEDEYYMSHCYLSLADIYRVKGNYPLAEDYGLKGLAIIKKLNDKDQLKNSYLTLVDVASAAKEYEKAFRYQQLVQNLSDSLSNDALNKRIGQMQAMYEADKMQSRIDLLTKDNEIQGEKITRQRVVTYTVVAGLLLVLVLAFISFRRYREKKRAHVEITKQKEIIETKNKEIVDSIHYAKRIQGALLASDQLLNKNLPAHFVLYKPKDIVSGDFYWAAETPGSFILATCDCTGHGVPGAFMSLLNISKLSETISEKKITQPDLIFNEVRSEIIAALNPDGSIEESRDGMDAIICAFDFKNKKLQFAAANNSLIIVRNNSLIEYKADKFPVGMHPGELKPFTAHTVELQEGDLIFTFTDGYPDQFGGAKGKKFMSRNFKEALLSVSSFPLEQQKQELEKTFESWKNTFEQVDDVLVIGIRV